MACGALLGVSAQAMPMTTATVSSQLSSGDAVQKVSDITDYRRWGYRSHRRWGYRGYYSDRGYYQRRGYRGYYSGRGYYHRRGYRGHRGSSYHSVHRTVVRRPGC